MIGAFARYYEVIISRRMGWWGNVARREEKIQTRFCLGSVKEIKRI
jgi:hypothetical protein